MKSLCTCVVAFFLAASALSCGYASGQTTAESDHVQTYAIGQCKINVTLAQDSELDLTNAAGYVDYSYYGFSLNTTQMAKRYSELISTGRFKLYCQTGLPQDGVPLEWHRFDDTLVYMKNSSLIPSDSEKEFYGFELTGNNWKGVVTVKKLPPEDPYEEKPIPNPPDKAFNFCIQENNGSQVICGNALFDIDGNIEIERAIEVLRTIRFDSSFVPVSPSFDCTKLKPRALIEKVICANAELSRLDAVLDLDYGQLEVARLNTKERVDEQRAWIKVRNACRTPQCLRDAYTMRIDQICTRYIFEHPDYYDTTKNLPKCFFSSSALSSEPEGQQNKVKRAIEALKAKRLRKR